MKLTVEANDFCIDECPQCEIEKLSVQIATKDGHYSTISKRQCKYKDLCKIAVEMAAGKGEQ